MDEPARRTHFAPRTHDGRAALLAFVALFALAMPPVTHLVVSRIEASVAGVPFFFAALFVVYTALIGVLVWAYRRGV